MYYLQPYGFQPYDPYGTPDRAYPPVDTSTFGQSITKFQKAIAELSTLLNKLADPSFATKLMNAAQRGDQHQVERLIRSTGFPYAVTTNYTPTGIALTIHIDAYESLAMFLRWGR